MRLFVFLGSLIVLLLAAALVAPPYVDWDRYKDQFEEQASRVLGQKVEVRGTTSLRLLPLPTITFNDLVVGDDGQDGPKLTAQSFRMDLELAPLLRGNIVIVDMALTKPDLSLAIDTEGKVDWVNRSSDLPATFSGDDVQVENITIIDGRLRVDDKKRERNYTFDAVNLTASARTLVGPWRVAGRVAALTNPADAAAERKDLRFALNTGRWQHDKGQLSLRLTLEPKDLPYDFGLNGPFVLRNGVPSITGQFTVRPASAADDNDRIVFPRAALETALPIRVEGDVLLVPGGVTVPAYKLDVGPRDAPYTLTGTGRASFGERATFRATAEGQQINLEQLNAAQNPRQGGGSENQNSATGGAKRLTLKERIDVVRALANKLPRFSADGLVSLYLPAVVAGDTVIREIGVDLRPVRKSEGGEPGWSMRNFEAQLPGRTELRADGDVYLGDAPSYSGELIVASKQPSGFAAWVGAEDDPAIRSLPSAGFSANAAIDGTGIRFDDLEIALGTASLTGSLARKRAEGEASSLDAELTGNTVNLDQLAALYRLFRSANPTSANGEGYLAGEAMSLSLSGQTVLLDGLTAEDVALVGRLDGEGIALETLSIGSLAGAQLSAKGSLAGVASSLKGAASGQMAVSVKASDVTGLMELIEQRVGPMPILSRLSTAPDLVDETELDITIKASGSGLSVQGEGISGGTFITLTASDLGLTTGGIQNPDALTLVLENANSAKLLRQMNVPSIVDLSELGLAESGRGALRLQARKGDKASYRVEGALTLLDGYASFEGPLTPTRNGAEVMLAGTLQVATELSDLDAFASRFALTLPGAGFGQSARGTLALAFDGDRVEARTIDARVAQTKATGSLALKWPARGDISLVPGTQPRASVPVVTGKLQLNRLHAPTVLELVHGGSAASQATFGAARDGLLDRFDARIDLSVDQLLFAPVGASSKANAQDNAAKGLRAKVRLQDSDLGFNEVRALMAGGEITGDLSLGKTLSGRFVNGQFSATGLKVSSARRMLSVPLDVQGTLNGAITFDSSVEVAGADDAVSLLSGLTGNGTLTMSGGTINGLNAKALKPILRAADRLEDDALAGRGADLAASTIYAGSFEFGAVEVPFSISGGVIRAANVQLANEAASLLADTRIELTGSSAPTLSMNARLGLDPGLEAVTGASPEMTLRVEGPLEQPVSGIDAALLDSYLGLRLSEKRERAFEAQRSAILERQRLLQTVRLYDLKARARRLAREEQERIERLAREQEEARRREEQERKRREREQARIQAELEAAQRRAEQEAAEEAGRRERRQQEIEELRRSAEEAARRLERLRETRDGLDVRPDP